MLVLLPEVLRVIKRLLGGINKDGVALLLSITISSMLLLLLLSHYGVAVADPDPATATTHAGAHSTSPTPRDPGAVNGGGGLARVQNTRGVVQDAMCMVVPI